LPSKIQFWASTTDRNVDGLAQRPSKKLSNRYLIWLFDKFGTAAMCRILIQRRCFDALIVADEPTGSSCAGAPSVSAGSNLEVRAGICAGLRR
jgi:hypothetical protein